MGRHVTFKQADIQRAVAGARAGGVEVAKVEIDPATGKITITIGRETVAPEDPLDKWLRDNAG